MRLGLFGGTFDPVHSGHLKSAQEVREAYALDEVCFVPCGVPPHRNARPGAAAHHRLEMVRLAVADNPGLGVSDLEVMRPGASYSIDTVRHFAARLAPGDALYLILGLDAFLLIGSWKDWRELLALTHVIVTSRPGFGGELPYDKIPVVVREAFCYDPLNFDFEGHAPLRRHGPIRLPERVRQGDPVQAFDGRLRVRLGHTGAARKGEINSRPGPFGSAALREGSSPLS